MSAEKHIVECDYAEIELRVIAFMLDNSFEQQQAINRRERTVTTMMTPTGRYRDGHRAPKQQTMPPLRRA